jgi:hypothetical protein
MLQASSAVIQEQVTEDNKIMNVDLNKELVGVKFTEECDTIQVEIKENTKALEHEGTRLSQQKAVINEPVTEDDKIMKADVNEELGVENFAQGSEKVKMKENALSGTDFDKVYIIIV